MNPQYKYRRIKYGLFLYCCLNQEHAKIWLCGLRKKQQQKNHTWAMFFFHWCQFILLKQSGCTLSIYVEMNDNAESK